MNKAFPKKRVNDIYIFFTGQDIYYECTVFEHFYSGTVNVHGEYFLYSSGNGLLLVTGK